MKIIETGIPEVKIVEPDVYGDHRGWFYESYSKKKLAELGLDIDFVQDNRSYSAQKGTLRGLHFQASAMAQSKLICATRGVIKDVAVDIRVGSPTYLRWVAVELSADNKRMLFIPKGFAHGFLTLSDDVEVLYKVDEYYSPEHDGGFRFDDPTVNVDWGIEAPILSAKDETAPLLADSKADFVY